MVEILVAYAPFLVVLALLIVWLRYRARLGVEATAKMQDRMTEQSELGRRHLALLERQIAELKRIADALERRGG